MDNALFPVFDVPAKLAGNKGQTQKYNRAPLFDIEGGDFVLGGSRQPRYGSGHDAWILWCVKTMMTQRWAHAGYGGNAGIEADEAFKEPDRKARESVFIRTITEALLADPMGRTRQVRGFRFIWMADSLIINCEVIGYRGNSAKIGAELNT